MLILDAAQVLHDRGYENLAIDAGMAPSGMYWHVTVTDSLREVDDHAFRYSTGCEFEIGRLTVSRKTLPDEVADEILTVFEDLEPEPEPRYAKWYRELLSLVHRHDRLPISGADYFDDDLGWEIGWGSGVRYPRPPERSDPESQPLPHVKEFSTDVSNEIGWYVYALRNPLNGKIFYIGIGEGNRVFDHANTAQAPTDTVLDPETDLIKRIQAGGYQVDVLIVRHGLASEDLAREVEASLIDMLALLDADCEGWHGLTSVHIGDHLSERGLAGADDVARMYDAPDTR
jgi:hypothetical protein